MAAVDMTVQTWLPAAVALGWLTGVSSIPHCAVMCGPLASAGCQRHGGLGGAGVGLFGLGWSTGRVLTYAGLGGALGFAGQWALVDLTALTSTLRWVNAAVALGAAFYCVAWLVRAWPGRRRPLSADSLIRKPAPPLSHPGRTVKRGALLGMSLVALPCSVLWVAGGLAFTQAYWASGAVLMACFAVASAPGSLSVLGARWLPLPGAVRRWLPPVMAAAAAAIMLWRGSVLLQAPESGAAPCPLHAAGPVSRGGA